MAPYPDAQTWKACLDFAPLSCRCSEDEVGSVRITPPILHLSRDESDHQT
jgi:hypothetical protein